MPRVRGFLRILKRDRWGRPDQGLPGGVDPVDPDFGIDEGAGPDQGFNPDYPDQGFPPGHPGHLPGHPGHSLPERPGHGLPVWPGRPVDPGFGVDEDDVRPGHLPIWPVIPERPDTGLPPVPGQPLPPTDPPPGTIWPPLPPGLPTGKMLALVWLTGVGYRYVVIEVKADQGGPGAPPAAQPKR